MDLIWFVAEMAVYVSVGYWGFARTTWPRRLGMAIGGIVLFATVWGLYCAPLATFPLDGAAKVAVEAAWFAAGAAALVAARRTRTRGRRPTVRPPGAPGR
ncbi:YrdB family protein [Microbispora sp. RL4-1S]|uniref:YrdB family protein n=1 Tax=Microbispora oryzae TaxID=2806554 RepID=A0A940WH60_9ACTN|nr:YrdB family protein [Microbispora oryzae]MBP2705451.1 YrdB family protein [Microbispora oryzae]